MDGAAGRRGPGLGPWLGSGAPPALPAAAPGVAELRQVLVLPRAEWDRIRDSVGRADREAARAQAERRERRALHERSRALTKHWPNTVAGLAQKNLEARKLREEREEEEKKKLDLEEAQLQAAMRKEAIEAAKIYQYYQTDRVKGLHQALLLTEVLREREAQIEFKKKKTDINKKREEEMEHEREKAILEEQEKAHERHMKQQALCRDQLEQIKEHKHQAELAKLEAKREAEGIQRLTRLYELDVLREKEKKEKEKLEHKRAHLEYIADQHVLKAVKEQKEEEENDKIRAHFKAKQTLAKLRQEKEAEMNRLMQERQDNIINRLAAQMKQTFQEEDERVARAVAEKEAVWEEQLKEKEEKHMAELKSIAEYRAAIMKMKKEKEQEERLEAKKKLQELTEADRIYLEMEKEKKQRQHNENIKTKEFQIQQMAERRATREQEKQKELDYDAQREIIAIYKEQEFQEYAKQVIESESKIARNLYPLLKAAKERTAAGHGPIYRERGQIRPSYLTKDVSGIQLPSCSSNTAQEIKAVPDNDSVQTTKSRPGFT